MAEHRNQPEPASTATGPGGTRGDSTDTGDGPALDDRAIAALRPGDQVIVERWLPAAADRPAHTRSWQVEVGAIVRPRLPADGWILVPAVSDPPHPIDFHIGTTGYGMYTCLRQGPESAS